MESKTKLRLLLWRISIALDLCRSKRERASKASSIPGLHTRGSCWPVHSSHWLAKSYLEILPPVWGHDTPDGGVQLLGLLLLSDRRKDSCTVCTPTSLFPTQLFALGLGVLGIHGARAGGLGEALRAPLQAMGQVITTVDGMARVLEPDPFSPGGGAGIFCSLFISGCP